MSFDKICSSAIIEFIVSVERLLSVTILQHNSKISLRYLIARLLQARLALYFNYT